MRRGPLERLLYDPVLDGPPVDIPQRHSLKPPRPACTHEKTAHLVEYDVEITFCTRCGVGIDAEGTFNRAAGEAYGQRFDTRAALAGARPKDTA